MNNKFPIAKIILKKSKIGDITFLILKLTVKL